MVRVLLSDLSIPLALVAADELRIGDAVSVGHASGGYNICSVQLNSDYAGGWSK
jgi:hypothetical protein